MLKINDGMCGRLHEKRAESMVHETIGIEGTGIFCICHAFFLGRLWSAASMQEDKCVYHGTSVC